MNTEPRTRSLAVRIRDGAVATIGLLVAAAMVTGALPALTQSTHPVGTSPHTSSRPQHFDAYVITAIGTQASAVNSSGAVAGIQGTQSFLFTPTVPNGWAGDIRPLGTLGGTTCIAKSINASGHITGYSTHAGGTYSSFLWIDGVMTDIGGLAGNFSSADTINDVGQIVGFAYGADDEEHGYLWTPGRANGTSGNMIDLGTLGGEYSEALGINAHGKVVGYAYTPQGAFHAFVYDGASMIDLGTLGGSYSKAVAIDEHGRIVGHAYLSGNSHAHAVLWDESGIHDLGNLGGNYSEALAIDPSGHAIVGQATVPSSSGFLHYHAFLYTDGAMQDLNASIPADSGWELEEALGINGHGQIVGHGTWQGESRGFLLTPR